MAEYNEQSIKFGWLKRSEMMSAIETGHLNEHDICFTKDSHEIYLINDKLEPISIKSRIRIFGSIEAAIEEINNSSCTYAGEILSIKDGEKFIAFQVNQFDDGRYYVSPIYSDSTINYDQLQNIPIKNLNGTPLSPIVLADLDDGHYKITGTFITPTGTELTTVVGSYIVIESFIDKKTVKRISNDTIIDYTIAEDGNCRANKYATEDYIKDQGFATSDDVESRISALQVSLENYVKEYVSTTCTLLIKHLIDDELNSRYSSEDDIRNLFK